MAIDPVCHMQVDEASALKAERDGQTHYFCSDHCRRKSMEANQQERKHHRDRKQGDARYICPMCEGVESDRPGSCPRCGMALELAEPPKRKNNLHLSHAPGDRAGRAGNVSEVRDGLGAKNTLKSGEKRMMLNCGT